LEEIVMVELIHDPGAILDRLREKIITTLKQSGNIGENKDGMDLVFCCLDPATNILHYAAANNSLFVVRGKELWELKADKQPCGFFHELKPFNTRSFQLIDGDSIYAFSDGYPDQFGGPKGKKFKYAQLENMLLENAQLDMKEQKTILINRMKDWMGEKQTQIDDMLVVGLKV
jgi:phosphoserine phosphatase RsbU/P